MCLSLHLTLQEALSPGTLPPRLTEEHCISDSLPLLHGSPQSTFKNDSYPSFPARGGAGVAPCLYEACSTGL